MQIDQFEAKVQILNQLKQCPYFSHSDNELNQFVFARQGESACVEIFIRKGLHFDTWNRIIPVLLFYSASENKHIIKYDTSLTKSPDSIWKIGALPLVLDIHPTVVEILSFLKNGPRQ